MLEIFRCRSWAAMCMDSSLVVFAVSSLRMASGGIPMAAARLARVLASVGFGSPGRPVPVKTINGPLPFLYSSMPRRKRRTDSSPKKPPCMTPAPSPTVGLVRGNLFAPNSGEEIRHNLGSKVDDLTHKVQEKIQSSAKNVTPISRLRRMESIEDDDLAER